MKAKACCGSTCSRKGMPGTAAYDAPMRAKISVA
jgi:hypothetical protein